MRLLLVDDDPITRIGLKKHIPWAELGIASVDCAADGADAITLATELHPNIVITDVMMPNVDGIELGSVITKMLPACRLIYISSYDEKDYLKAAIQMQAVSYVEKPIDLDLLRDSVRRAVSMCKQEQLVGKLFDRKLPIDEFQVDKDAVRECIRYIGEHISDCTLSVQRIAGRVYLSPTYLSTLFKNKTGETINEYITRTRIEKSKALLEDCSFNLHDIAVMVGYRDSHYFAKRFKHAIGCNPSVYRMRHRQWQNI